MTRKFLMAAAVSLVAAAAAMSAGTARADWYHHGWHDGWHRHAWHYHHHGVWYPGYYNYRFTPYPYVVPSCYVTVYGTTACY